MDRYGKFQDSGSYSTRNCANDSVKYCPGNNKV